MSGPSMRLLMEYNVDLFFFAVLLSQLVLFPCILIMHFLMPKQVLERFWRTPHFRPVELALFTDTIYAPMRTVMLMGAIAFPGMGRKRNVMEAGTLAPAWYRVASKILCIWIAGGVGILILLLFVFIVVGYATGDPVF